MLRCLSSPKTEGCALYIYTDLCESYWSPSLADCGVSGPHREVDDRPRQPFETGTLGIPLIPSGICKTVGSFGASTRKREGYDPLARAGSALQQGIRVRSVGGLIPSRCEGSEFLFLFLTCESSLEESSTGYQPKLILRRVGFINHARRRKVSVRGGTVEFYQSAFRRKWQMPMAI